MAAEAKSVSAAAARPVVPRAAWLEARTALLAKEKAFTKARDELSKERRALPWVRVDEPYAFRDARTRRRVTLADLFGPHRQLVVVHFMFADAWTEGCKSCSFFADSYDRLVPHLAARDVALVAVSSARPAKLAAYAKKLGWSFRWVSAAESTFSRDFGVTFDPPETDTSKKNYNFATQHFGGPEAPGVSVFSKEEDGGVFHTYSTFARGLDDFLTAYRFLDVVPKGRDEAGFDFPMTWIRRRTEYDPKAMGEAPPTTTTTNWWAFFLPYAQQ